MNDDVDILSNIEQAILARLQEKGLEFAQASITDDKGVPLNSPAVHIEVARGEFESIGGGEAKAYRMSLTIGLVIFVRSCGDSALDLKLLHGLQMGVTQVLMNWPKAADRAALKLDIRPLAPVSWDNATTDEWWEQGIRVFICTFRSSIEIQEPTDAELAWITKIGITLSENNTTLISGNAELEEGGL